MFKICVVILQSFYCYEAVAQLHTNFKITRIERRDSNKGPVKLHHLNITDKKDGQYVNYDITTKIPFDHHIGSICSIKYAVDGKTFIPLFLVREHNACRAANQYLGNFWYDLERASGAAPGVCPILAGRYYVHDYLLDYRKITLQTFPFGKLKFIFNVTDSQNNGSVIFCLLVELQNISN